MNELKTTFWFVPVLIIIFIHRIAISIQADKMISEISRFISRQVKTLFPAKMGEESESGKSPDITAIKSGYSKTVSEKSPKSGYLQYIDSKTLMKNITRNKALLELHFRPGGFLVEGMEIGLLHSNEKMEKEEVEKILKQLVIGKTKTPQQDLEYSIHQMVEIAVRALSTGVNDPYIAIVCIDNLTSAMCYLAAIKFPSEYRFDDENNLRIIADTMDFEGILDVAFNQIRQYSAGSTAVIIRLMEVLITIHKFAKMKTTDRL